MRTPNTLSNRGRLALAFGFLASLTALEAIGATAPPVYKPKGRVASRPPIQYLADTTVIARVDDRVIRVRDYVERYFNSYLEFRPSADSGGRVEFLNRLVDKEVIAKVARKVAHPETYEDRAALRTHTQRVLGNILFERTILDSVHITEAQMQAVYQQMKRELHLGRIRFGSFETARRMKIQIESGRLAWSRAWDLRLRLPSDTTRSWDIGWRKYSDTPPALSSALFSLPVGAVSDPVQEPPGYSLYTVREERPTTFSGGFPVVRNGIRDMLKSLEYSRRRELLMTGLRREIGLSVDSVQVSWVAARFPIKFGGSATAAVTIDVSVPDIAAEDTGRVVATFKGGQITVGRLLDVYKSTEDVSRPSLGLEDDVRSLIDVLVLEPRLADIARSRGYDRDSVAVVLIARKREELMVEHLFQDSIQARVFVPPGERRKYYQENHHRFVTEPSVRYALFYVESKVHADSMAARLRRGITAREIIRADSVAGYVRGHFETQGQGQTGAMFHKVLFQELKEGEVLVHGPDDAGGYNVVQLVHHDFGRTVPFEEADRQIDEYLQQEMANSLLAAFTARHRGNARIEAHPELVMRVNLVEPGDD